MKVIVTAGGTGGHIYPALAIIDKLKKEEKNLKLLYIGTTDRMEKDIVPSKGISYEGLEIYGFMLKKPLRNLKNLFLIHKAKQKCSKIIKQFKPDIVIGVGGYVTYPVLTVAKGLHIPVLIHEQNVIPGKTNRLLSSNADVVATTFKESSKYFPKAKKVIWSGHPSGANAVLSLKINKKDLGVDEHLPLVVIVAGSLGSYSLNNIMKKFIEKLSNKKYSLIYITGQSHYEEFIKDLKIPSNVKVIPYESNMAGLMKASEVLISRAGAGIISEFLALNVPTILIPSPNVALNHQYYNALDVAKSGAAIMIEEKDLTEEKLISTLEDLLVNATKKNMMKDAQKKLVKLDSLDIIYNEIKTILR